MNGLYQYAKCMFDIGYFLCYKIKIQVDKLSIRGIAMI